MPRISLRNAVEEVARRDPTLARLVAAHGPMTYPPRISPRYAGLALVFGRPPKVRVLLAMLSAHPDFGWNPSTEGTWQGVRCLCTIAISPQWRC